jgi:hypothetical protein
MSWFEHRHYWRPRSDIELTTEGRAKGIQFVEGCCCGAVRTIEIYPGKAPVVRIAQECVKCEERE